MVKAVFVGLVVIGAIAMYTVGMVLEVCAATEGDRRKRPRN